MNVQYSNNLLTSLPGEVICRIASTLEVTDLLALYKVCQIMKNVLKYYEKELLLGKSCSSFSLIERKSKNILLEVKQENSITRQYSIKLFPKDLLDMASDFITLISGFVSKKNNLKVDFCVAGPTKLKGTWFIKYDAVYRPKEAESTQTVKYSGIGMNAEKIAIKDHFGGACMEIYDSSMHAQGDEKILSCAKSIENTLELLFSQGTSSSST